MESEQVILNQDEPTSEFIIPTFLNNRFLLTAEAILILLANGCGRIRDDLPFTQKPSSSPAAVVSPSPIRRTPTEVPARTPTAVVRIFVEPTRPAEVKGLVPPPPTSSPTSTRTPLPTRTPTPVPEQTATPQPARVSEPAPASRAAPPAIPQCPSGEVIVTHEPDLAIYLRALGCRVTLVVPPSPQEPVEEAALPTIEPAQPTQLPPPESAEEMEKDPFNIKLENNDLNDLKGTIFWPEELNVQTVLISPKTEENTPEKEVYFKDLDTDANQTDLKNFVRHVPGRDPEAEESLLEPINWKYAEYTVSLLLRDGTLTETAKLIIPSPGPEPEVAKPIPVTEPPKAPTARPPLRARPDMTFLKPDKDNTGHWIIDKNALRFCDEPRQLTKNKIVEVGRWLLDAFSYGRFNPTQRQRDLLAQVNRTMEQQPDEAIEGYRDAEVEILGGEVCVTPN